MGKLWSSFRGDAEAGGTASKPDAEGGAAPASPSSFLPSFLNRGATAAAPADTEWTCGLSRCASHSETALLRACCHTSHCDSIHAAVSSPPLLRCCCCCSCRSQRFQAFVVAVLGGAALMAIAVFVFLPMIIFVPSKFALSFTLGSLMFFGAFMLLRGPKAVLRQLTSPDRVGFTGAYAASIGAHTYALVVVVVCVARR
jgi:hypothetical protein